MAQRAPLPGPSPAHWRLALERPGACARLEGILRAAEPTAGVLRLEVLYGQGEPEAAGWRERMGAALARWAPEGWLAVVRGGAEESTG